MAEYALGPRRVPLEEGWDVLVAGGGPAGVASAVAAAREGAKVLLLEATGCLGGMGTAGLGPAWACFSDGEKMIYRGLAERVLGESKKGVPHQPTDRVDWCTINAEQLKRVYDDLVAEAGVAVRFFTVVLGVEMAEEGVVDVVLAGNKAGLVACKAKVYVDCTGDGDLAAWAGAPFEKGDPRTGELQPGTHCFLLSHVDGRTYAAGPNLNHSNPGSPIWEILRSGKYPQIPDGHLAQALSGPDTLALNAGHVPVDATDPASLSAAMPRGRRLAETLRRALAEFYPEAFGESFLAATAPLMGVRESRRILGDYVLTVQDYMARRSFPDEIGRNCFEIDVHRTDRSETDPAHRKTDLAGFERYASGESHGIPYRCLTPRRLRNVLVAGRCISTDRPVNGSVRIMSACLVTGEAAGTAAAMAAADDPPDVHAVDTDRLRRRLRDGGAYLPDVGA